MSQGSLARDHRASLSALDVDVFPFSEDPSLPGTSSGTGSEMETDD